jgi:long-chain acyl-CoA synthetase
MLESALKECPLIGQACTIGDGRPYLTAIVVLDNEVAVAWASEAGIAFRDLGDLACSPMARAKIEEHIADINGRFAAAEQIRAVHIVGDEWLPDSRFLTPTAKLKRREVTAAYADVIDDLYAGREQA